MRERKKKNIKRKRCLLFDTEKDCDLLRIDPSSRQGERTTTKISLLA